MEAVNKKAAVVIGGASGAGMAVACELAALGRHVHILDRVEPGITNKHFTFHYCDLLDYDEGLIKALAADEAVDTLFISAGFGRVTDFENLHIMEIENLFMVNTVGAIKAMSGFYERIKSKDTFYCGVIASIAGFITSPMFSVYGASKAALCSFADSVNIELECNGYKNRILNVSPGSIKGTSFNKGVSQPALLSGLAKDIVHQLMSSSKLFIPEYDTVFKGVLDRYKADKHAFGLSAYQYKKDSGRVSDKKDGICVGYLSGTWDLFHVGHINILKRAKAMCDYLIVGVHGCGARKGKETFIPLEERKSVLSAVKYVDLVIDSKDEDADVWQDYKYDKLFVGSDYKGTERFEKYEKYFADKGVEIVYFPYTQGTSSTQLRNALEVKDAK